MFLHHCEQAVSRQQSVVSKKTEHQRLAEQFYVVS
jgi:hypothetical protein